MTYAWIEVSPGRSVYRKTVQAAASQRSSLPAPRILRDAFSDPVQSMADGKFYSSKAALRATYKPSGNPQGKEYVEIGNEDISGFEPPKIDRKAQRDAIERAIEDVANGNVPPVLTQAP